MSVKYVELPDIGKVTLQKKRGNRSLRINIDNKGQVRVTMPSWTPYRMALQYVITKKDWIAEHKPAKSYLNQDMRVGKAHQLTFVTKPSIVRASSRLSGNNVKIILPTNVPPDSAKAQDLAHKAIERALKHEAEQLLPARLRQLATTHGFNYEDVYIKRLSSRWGSCDQKTNITLNCYLMQLPWRLIDYVLLHELTHTKIMAHGPKFWQELGNYVSNLPAIRKEIRQHRPSLYF